MIKSWIEWWKTLSVKQKYLPVSFVTFYWSILGLTGNFHKDPFLFGALILILSYTCCYTAAFLEFILPLLMVGIVYDSQRYYEDYIRGPVHVEQPYLFDKTFFGIHTAQGILTPNEWLQLHTLPLLDFICGFFYLTFIFIFICICAYFYFVLSKSNEKAATQKHRPMWAFFWVNVIGYTTYYWYAAAPPWYVALYGLGPARMDTPANPAGCVRFDAIFGTHFFTGMYGKSADVFGAIPSLHVAYPLLAAIFAWRFGALRVFCTLFYVIMCFSAVYLNHHYVLDILAGSLYAVFTLKLVDSYFTKFSNRC